MKTNEKLDYKLLQQFDSLEILARQIVEGFIVGLHKSPFHGFSVEFSEHRLYNPGESTRHIDWKLFARTERLFIKKYEEETNLRCHILLDCSNSMYFPSRDKNKFLFSAYAAASLIHLLRKQRDASGLCFFDEGIKEISPAKSNPAHIQWMYGLLDSFLKKEESQKRTNAAEVIHQVSEAIHRRSLVIIFSDMFDNVNDHDTLFRALQHLKYNKHEVILFHTTDADKELDFNFKNVPHRFVDVETGKEVKAYPSEVREEYLKQTQSFYKELKLRCAQYEIEFIEADINRGFAQILQPFLIKRARMY